MDLPRHPVKHVAQMWTFHQLKGRLKNAPGVIGRAMCFGNGGQTTANVDVDPKTRRVLTASGSVYELGVPNLGFAVANPALVQEAGVSA